MTQLAPQDSVEAESADASASRSGALGPDPLEVFDADASSRARIDSAIEEIALSSLVMVATALAAIYAILIGAHAVLENPDAQRILMPLAGITAIVSFQVRRMVIGEKIRIEHAHAVGAALGLLAGANGLVQIWLTQTAAHTANLIVLVLGAGVVLLSRRSFFIIAAVAVAGWAVVYLNAYHLPMGAGPSQYLDGMTPPNDATETWRLYGYALIGAVVGGYSIMALRLTTFRRIEAFHLQDQLRQDELEHALERTERARQGEAEARSDLEDAVDSLKESELRFRRLADASFEGVLIHSNGHVRDANRQAAELFGLKQEQLAGVAVVDLFRCSESHEAIGEDGALPAECEGIRTDGTTFPAEVGNTEATVKGEGVTVTVVRDVTRQQQAEKILRDAAAAAEESNRAKSTFLANMSHELRTPLNAVIGFSNILRKNKDGSFADRDLEYLDRIVSNGKHLLALINDVLDLSKIEAGRMDVVIETVDLVALTEDLHRSFELQARRKGVSLVMDLPPRIEPIRGDGHRLKQILFNLVGNAMKFTDEGAVTIRVVAREGEEAPLRLEVEDSGIGIPQHRIAEIFSPFQQVDASTSRKYGGTGLGLAISRSLCEMMGFELRATSIEGQGSTFLIDFQPEEPVTPRFQPGSVTIAEEPTAP